MVLQSILKQYFHYDTFRPHQQEMIERVLQKQNILIVMPTGGGKSLCYQLPALIMQGTAIVISPLISLMKDQVDALLGRNISAAFINSSLSNHEIHSRLQQMVQGRYSLVYVSPERLRSKDFIQVVQKIKVSLIAVDEAHCISEWGHQFRPDYKKIKYFLERLPGIPVIAATATATEVVRQDIIYSLGLSPCKTFVTGFERKHLLYTIRYFETEEEKLKKLVQYIKKLKGSGIIYCASRKKVEYLEKLLLPYHQRVLSYHAGMEEKIRNENQEIFMKEEALMIATNAFGMGIDKANIRYVIHYHMPATLESYYQESGRAGRDGNKAHAIVLYTPKDRELRERFIELEYPKKEILEYIYENLRKQEEHKMTLGWIQKDYLQGKLSLYEVINVMQTLEKYKAIYIDPLDIEQNQWSIRLRNKDLSFGELGIDSSYMEILKKQDQEDFQRMMDWIESDGCRGIQILKYFGEERKESCGHCDICLHAKDPNYENVVTKGIYSKGLFERLKQERKKVAQTFGVSDYILANNDVLKEMSRRFPETKEELLQIYGIGKRNLQYLESFLSIIKGYKLAEPKEFIEIKEKAKDIFILHEKPQTKKLKSKILNLYLHGKSIEEIAKLCKRKMGTIEDYMAKIMEEYPIPLEDFVNREEQEKIKRVIEVCSNGEQGLRKIKEKLPEEISYTKIKYVLASLKRK